ncbi:hypothetical protein ACFLZL_00905 [Thermodesulfobacteriota bacterium]
MYQFDDDFNHKARFWFRKKLIKNMNWALLPKASKAIFPVIACHVNEHGIAFPSEQTIAILSGLTEKIVRNGIKGLEHFPSFEWKHYLTKRGRRSKKFCVKLPVENHRGKAFPFFRVVLEYGLWMKLSPTAKALYPVMRHFGFFEIDKYAEAENLEIDVNDFDAVFPERPYDFCEAEFGVLAEFSGINRRSLPAAINSLEKNYLVETLSEDYGWKVFLKSKDDTYFNRDYLNQMIMKKYRKPE